MSAATQRIAILSCLHGNLPAVEAVWDDVRAQGVDQVVCLDVLGVSGHARDGGPGTGRTSGAAGGRAAGVDSGWHGAGDGRSVPGAHGRGLLDRLWRVA